MSCTMPFNLPHRSCITTRDMFDKAGITEIPDSSGGIKRLTGSSGQAAKWGNVSGIYGWFFEQFIGKQGLEYANNGNDVKRLQLLSFWWEQLQKYPYSMEGSNGCYFAPVGSKAAMQVCGWFFWWKSAITFWLHSFPNRSQDVNENLRLVLHTSRRSNQWRGGVSIEVHFGHWTTMIRKASKYGVRKIPDLWSLKLTGTHRPISKL